MPNLLPPYVLHNGNTRIVGYYIIIIIILVIIKRLLRKSIWLVAVLVLVLYSVVPTCERQISSIYQEARAPVSACSCAGMRGESARG